MFSRPALLAVSALVLLAVAVSNDTFVPPITSPTAETKWTAGTVQTITWDASNAPDVIKTKVMVVLHKGDELIAMLADGFDLKTGYVDITVPIGLPPGKDYSITLYGDSTNISPAFEIVTSTPRLVSANESKEARE